MVNEKVCKDCGILLISEDNWPSSHQKKHYYVCRDCDNKRHNEEYRRKPELRQRISIRVAKYQKTHPEILLKIKQNRKEWNRLHSLTTNGIRNQGLHINKRPHPGSCELCHKNDGKRLGYHLWDDKELSMGVWVCSKCHLIIEAFDNKTGNSILPLYLNLKAKIEQEFKK